MTINEGSVQLPQTEICRDDKGGIVFLTGSGGVGMEFGGRLVVKSIENWIALAWGDLITRNCLTEGGAAVRYATDIEAQEAGERAIEKPRNLLERLR